MKTPESGTNYYDIVVNIKENTTGKYVYAIKMKRSHPCEATKAITMPRTASFNEEIISQNGQNVNTQNVNNSENYSLKEENDEVKEMRDLLVKARFDSKTIIRTEDIKPAVRKFLRKFNISENEIS